MKELTKSSICFILTFSLIFIFCGCVKKLDESYYIPSLNFKGLNFECFSDGNTANNVRNQMVYFDFCDFLKEDLESKGNKINSIIVTEATGDIFHDDQTIANMSVEIDAESGDIETGEYHILAYFTYNTSDTSNVKMYFMNYCFCSSSKIDTSLFEESYNLIKDKKIP